MRGFHLGRRVARLLVMTGVIACVGPIAVGPSRAEGFYGDKDQGWFFYDDAKPSSPSPASAPPRVPAPITPPPVPAPAVAPVVARSPPKAEPFSLEWLKDKMPILAKNAIDHPTPENVQAYMYAQRMMLDISQNFADMGERVAASDPYLNESVRFPTSAAARAGALWQVDRARDEILQNLSPRSGLWFFFDSRCGFCQSQLEVVRGVAKRYRFPVRYISEDGEPLHGMLRDEMVIDQGHATFHSFDLKLTPAVALVVPPSKVLIVAHGAMAEEDLQHKIVEAAIDADLVPQEMMDMAQLERRGIVSASDITSMRQAAARADTNDPKVLVSLMRGAIEQRLVSPASSNQDH